MKLNNLTIGLIGHGAIGSLFSYYWQNSNITIFTNKWSANKSPESKKTIIDLAQKKHTLKLPRKKISVEYLANIDVLIITVKAYQTAEVAKLLLSKMNERTQVLLVQNGMGGHEILHQFLPQNPIYAGITTDAVYMTESNSYQITAKGKLDVGLIYEPVGKPVTDRQINAIKTFLASHPNAEFHQDIRPHLFYKLAINSIINPLTALKNIKNGELLRYSDQYMLLINEVALVFEFLGIRADLDELTTKIEAVMQATKANYSSMHQDYHHGRQTEIDSMLGFLIKQAEQGEIQTPFMREIYQQISAHK